MLRSPVVRGVFSLVLSVLAQGPAHRSAGRQIQFQRDGTAGKHRERQRATASAAGEDRRRACFAVAESAGRRHARADAIDWSATVFAQTESGSPMVTVTCVDLRRGGIQLARFTYDFATDRASRVQ